MVFAATHNPEGGGYLRDATGNRRFWPVGVERACLPVELATVRDQLWAEAVLLYRLGHRWWLDTDELVLAAEAAQAERMTEPDPWETPLASWLADQTRLPIQVRKVTTSETLEHLGIKREHQTRGESMRVAAILRAQGWRPSRESHERLRVWVPPPPLPTSEVACATLL
jgi:putative DNA primase/helicase